MDRPELEIKGESGGVAPYEGSLADRAWEATKYNPYVSLAAGPVAGWFFWWGLASAWDTVNPTGTAVQDALGLIVVLLFVGRGALLFSRRDQKKRRLPLGSENRVLLALKEVGGQITPIEAAIETSLSVDETEQILSRLASRGHLNVESRGGTLSYAMPSRA